jgi:hypothetical protein
VPRPATTPTDVATPAEAVAPAPDPVIALHPGGVVVDTAEGPWGLGTATFDRSRRHRFRLSRVWDPGGPRCCFVMLNPSTADARTLDPTVTRCAGFARGWGYGALEVVNVFALRSTDPAALRTDPHPVGRGNDGAILAAASAADLVVAAWGTHGDVGGRGEAVRRLLTRAGIGLAVLRLTAGGHPGHPLYLPGDARPVPWPGPGSPAPETGVD